MVATEEEEKVLHGYIYIIYSFCPSINLLIIIEYSTLGKKKKSHDEQIGRDYFILDLQQN